MVSFQVPLHNHCRCCFVVVALVVSSDLPIFGLGSPIKAFPFLGVTNLLSWSNRLFWRLRRLIISEGPILLLIVLRLHPWETRFRIGHVRSRKKQSSIRSWMGQQTQSVLMIFVKPPTDCIATTFTTLKSAWLFSSCRNSSSQSQEHASHWKGCMLSSQMEHWMRWWCIDSILLLLESMRYWHRSCTGTRLGPFNLDYSLDCAATGVRWAYYEYYRNEYEYDGILTCKDIAKYNVIQTSLLWYERVMSWADAICAPPTRFCQEFCRNLVHQKEKCLRWSLNGSNLR